MLFCLQLGVWGQLPHLEVNTLLALEHPATPQEIIELSYGEPAPFSGLLFPIPLAEKCADAIVDVEKCRTEVDLLRKQLKEQKAAVSKAVKEHQQENALNKWLYMLSGGAIGILLYVVITTVAH